MSELALWVPMNHLTYEPWKLYKPKSCSQPTDMDLNVANNKKKNKNKKNKKKKKNEKKKKNITKNEKEEEEKDE